MCWLKGGVTLTYEKGVSFVTTCGYDFWSDAERLPAKDGSEESGLLLFSS